MKFFLIVLFAFVFSCTSKNSLPPGIEVTEVKSETGQLERFERRKSDFSKEGLYQKLGTDGKLIVEAHYVNNVLQGERKYYYTNGQVESSEMFTGGANDGAYKKYTETGALALEQQFVKGVMEGWSIAYYPNGAILEKVMIKDNDENGPFFEYHENGKIKTEGTYIPGESGGLEQGELKEYDENGNLVRVANCVGGVCATVSGK